MFTFEEISFFLVNFLPYAIFKYVLFIHSWTIKCFGKWVVIGKYFMGVKEKNEVCDNAIIIT